MAYKPEQGRIARTAAFWSLAFLFVYGCNSLNESLSAWGWSADPMGIPFGAVKDANGRWIGGATVPILSWKLTPALLVSIAVCVAVLIALYRYLNKPKVAELLIETENELRKVTWPTMNEAVNSSMVVIVCVLFLMAFLAGADFGLGWIVTRILVEVADMVAMKWFFIRCQSGREDTIAKNTLARLKLAGVQDLVPQVLVPFERVTDLKNGKKRTLNKKLYPGYLMVQADLEDAADPRVVKARNTLREIDGLREFLGSLGAPTPLTDAEVQAILARMSDSESRPQVTIGLHKGDMVKIKSGAFDGFDGVVEEVNPEKGTVKVIVTIFGRPTPVELEYWEVEKI